MLISAAYAQATAPAVPPGADLMSLFPLVAIFVVFYLLLIRPQAKRAKEQKLMIEALQKGDEVATASGVLGSGVQDQRKLHHPAGCRKCAGCHTEVICSNPAPQGYIEHHRKGIIEIL